MTKKNISERLFERYLNSNGFKGKWTYEPLISGKSNKPDYLLDYNGQECFFEVKELRKKNNEPTQWPAFIDPYTSLRTEINDARKQFKEFKGHSCSLVVYNVDDRQVRLDPLTILGAMLGNLGFEMDFDPTKGKAIKGTERNAFLNGGKMIDNKRKQPQNTTINAIIVLEGFRDDSEIQKVIKEEMKKQSKPLAPEERFAIVRKVIEDRPNSCASKVVLRVRVIENPFARIRLPDDIFMGHFDERWQFINGNCIRIFAGDKLKELEALKGKSV
jgi:hypothetical protein